MPAADDLSRGAEHPHLLETAAWRRTAASWSRRRILIWPYSAARGQCERLRNSIPAPDQLRNCSVFAGDSQVDFRFEYGGEFAGFLPFNEPAYRKNV
jgi:hypothetical protein